MKELQNLMSIVDVAKSFGVCVATVRRLSTGAKTLSHKAQDVPQKIWHEQNQHMDLLGRCIERRMKNETH